MLQLEILIRKSFRAVNAGTAGAIAIEEVSTLDHELSDNPVKFAAFVALRSSLRVFVLTCAVLAKIFRGFGCDVGEELHLHSTQWLPCKYQRGKYNCRGAMTVTNWSQRRRLRPRW